MAKEAKRMRTIRFLVLTLILGASLEGCISSSSIHQIPNEERYEVREGAAWTNQGAAADLAAPEYQHCRAKQFNADTGASQSSKWFTMSSGQRCDEVDIRGGGGTITEEQYQHPDQRFK